MVVAVIPVRMMQVPVHEVIDVIPVGYGRMPTVRAMNVVFVVALADVMNAPRRVDVRDRYNMLVVVAFMDAVQMPVVQVSHMVSVSYGYVTTVRTMLVGVVFVDGVGHGQYPQLTVSSLRLKASAGYCGLYGVYAILLIDALPPFRHYSH